MTDRHQAARDAAANVAYPDSGGRKQDSAFAGERMAKLTGSIVGGTRPDWQTDAACRGIGTELFFGERGHHQAQQAKELCAGCTVRAECLQWALDNNEKVGIFGGKTPKERMVIRRNFRQNPIKHGTPHGYEIHRARGELACSLCREARSAYQVRMRQQARERRRAEDGAA